MAWLNTIPKEQKQTRGERITEQGGDVSLPPCPAPFILGTLLDIGPALPGAFGMVPVGWRDIDAWQSCTGVKLPPWQAKLLIALSREYVAFSRTAEAPDCRAPWNEEDPQERRDRVAKQLRAAMTALARKD